MYALLIWKRKVVREGVPALQFLFERRDMGCFNGMNREHAYTWGQHVYDYCEVGMEVPAAALTQDGDRIAGNLSAESFRTNAVTVVGGALRSHAIFGASIRATVTNFECIGFGWISYTAHALNHGENHTDFYTKSSHARAKVPVVVDDLIAREDFFPSSRNTQTGNNRVNLREFTPNETEISRLLAPFNYGPNNSAYNLNSSRSVLPRQALVASGIARCIELYSFLRRTTMAIVGTERPSGLAVAYLQVMRNFGEQALQGFPNSPALSQFLNTSFDNGRRGCVLRLNDSALAYMSAFVNGGDDSDIISYSGARVPAAITRFSIWKLAHLFRNPSSMLVEGRYNKGGQSDSLRRNLDVKLTQLRDTSRIPAGIGRVPGILNEVRNIESEVSYATMCARNFNVADIIAHVSDRIRRISNPMTIIEQFQADCAAMADVTVTVPQTPTLPTDGAARTFHQWVATNDAATVH